MFTLETHLKEIQKSKRFIIMRLLFKNLLIEKSYSSTAACAAANFEAIMLISMICVWIGQHLSCNFRAFCTFCTLMSRNISQEYSFFCKIFVLFAGIFNYVIKSVFIQSLTFRVITQFGQQSGQHFARPFSL